MDEKTAPVSEREVLAFVGSSIASVWELELLLLLQREPERVWSPREIDRALRASDTVVNSSLRRLIAAQMVAEPARGQFRYSPSGPHLHGLVQALENLYRTNPVSVVKAILGEPDSQLKIFSDAFRFKE